MSDPAVHPTPAAAGGPPRFKRVLTRGDLIIYGMLREECRFLKVGLNHGRKQYSTRDGWRHEAAGLQSSGGDLQRNSGR